MVTKSLIVARKVVLVIFGTIHGNINSGNLSRCQFGKTEQKDFKTHITFELALPHPKKCILKKE